GPGARMIGPGWMPSRPRPLPRPRRSPLFLLGYRRRRRVRRRRAAPAHAPTRDPFKLCSDVFEHDGPAELPMATVHAGAWHARPCMLGGDLRRWLALQWAWLRPRALPLLVALIGMFAVLRATRYLQTLAHGDRCPCKTVRAHADPPMSQAPGHDAT